MATDDGEARPSEQARSPAGHPLESASDSGPSLFRKRPQSCLVRALWISFAFLLVFGAVFVGLTLHEDVDLVSRGSEASNDSAAASPVTDQDAVSSESASDSAGPISGTWEMFWTNSEGSERVAFTITFTGTDTGTLEVLNDDTESQTSFTVEGDQVRFKFTRTLELQEPYGTCPEGSTFDGTLTGPDAMLGKWARQGWEGSPDGGCRHTGEWSPYVARLIRMSE